MQEDKKHFDVVVIGGGASGMFAAAHAARLDASVLLLEKNKRLGEKLRITGGGRCNITNAEFDTRVLLKNYGSSEQFLYSAFSKHGVQDSLDFFAGIGLQTKVEAKKRVFPVSEKAEDVVNILQTELKILGVKVQTGQSVSRILHDDTAITGVRCGMVTYTANSYILATGGTSRPETGATGDGFNWLSSLSHTVKAPSPSITPLAIKEKSIAVISGVTAKSVRATFYCDNEKSFRLDGDILFTHFGVSGPLILSNAYKVDDLLAKGKVTMLLDFMPLIDQKTLDSTIVSILHESGAKQLKNVVKLFAPEGTAPYINKSLEKSIDLNQKAADVTKDSRLLLVKSIKESVLTVDKLMGLEKAVVADGGVSLKEIDTRTFRSKLYKNLYITGDLLDINRPSGGYSLQLCWTSGYVAGVAAVTTR